MSKCSVFICIWGCCRSNSHYLVNDSATMDLSLSFATVLKKHYQDYLLLAGVVQKLCVKSAACCLKLTTNLSHEYASKCIVYIIIIR